MTGWMKRLFFVTLLALPFGAGAAHADVSADDRGAIRTIIEGQIDAFQRDDGDKAYSFASPTIQGLFPSVDQFMAMVRGGYQPVYRPQAVVFGEVLDTPRGPIQRVFLTGPTGKNWVAIYSLQQQPDGSWRISGCQLVEDKGETV